MPEIERWAPFIEDQAINTVMVRMGMAWWYRRYDKTEELENAERYAKENKIGLWADKNPIAPWDWRKGFIRYRSFSSGMCGPVDGASSNMPSNSSSGGSSCMGAVYQTVKEPLPINLSSNVCK